MVINHSITHLSEFRQVGEIGRGWNEKGRKRGVEKEKGMEECRGRKEEERREELNDKEGMQKLHKGQKEKEKRRKFYCGCVNEL